MLACQYVPTLPTIDDIYHLRIRLQRNSLESCIYAAVRENIWCIGACGATGGPDLRNTFSNVPKNVKK
jgi:hypothetical protein